MRSSKTALDGLFFWNPEAVRYSESSVNTYWWRYFSTIKLLSNMTFYSHVDPSTNQLRVVTQILESHNKKNKDCKNQKNLLSAVCSFGLVWTLPKNFTRLIDCCVFKKWRYFKPPFPQAVFSLFLFAQQRARKKSVTVHQKDERKWLEVSSTPNYLTQKYGVRLVDSLHVTHWRLPLRPSYSDDVLLGSRAIKICENEQFKQVWKSGIKILGH